jgi:hypothetical protein
MHEPRPNMLCTPNEEEVKLLVCVKRVADFSVKFRVEFGAAMGGCRKFAFLLASSSRSALTCSCKIEGLMPLP